ncbi:spore germination protein [Neobacillus ginsengisoli]|uniref:Spore germination protein KA n=1 Tax=Neobacillus ginsengisoli TaxID=904295 RepID=A0ABT9XR90_9BACI|nr:spore germination protein [Neobacillus ginsengisoli]MDQ0198053.1 spore germination protein KA [Neobacillus ginsengisoli]
MKFYNEVSNVLHYNIQTLNTILGESSDFQAREITLTSINRKAAVLFIEEIVDSNAIQRYIIEPLLTYNLPHFKTDEELLAFMESAVIQSKNITRVEDMTLASSELLAGKTLVMVDGLNTFLSTNTTKWNARSIESPKGQRVSKGPDVGFSENRSTNISLVRKIIKNPNVRVTTKQYGTNTHTDVSVMYIENIVDKQILETIYERLENLQLDAVLEANYIEMVLTKESKSFFPLMLNTDRPDVIAGEMLEGKIAIFVDGSPYVLIAPAVLVQFFQTPEDYYIGKTGLVNIRLFRCFLYLIALYIPGLYVASVTYHANLLPVKLLVGFVSQRELVPFPTSFEVSVLIIVIIAINESSTRLQQNIAITVSIFGGIILGQSAIESQLVEPASLVVVSVAFIFVSVVPISSMRASAAVITLSFISGGAALGFYGIALLSLVFLLHLCSLRSFGVPYLSPFAPVVAHDLKDSAIQLSQEEMTNDESQFMKEETVEETDEA